MKVKKVQNPHQPTEDKQPEWNLFSLFLHKQQQSEFGDYPNNKINKSIDFSSKGGQNKSTIPIKKCKKNMVPKVKQIANCSDNNKPSEDEKQHQLKQKYERHNNSYHEAQKVPASSLSSVQTDENTTRNKSALNHCERIIHLTRNSSEIFPQTKLRENGSSQSNKTKKSNVNKSQILLNQEIEFPSQNRQKRALSSEAVKRSSKFPSPKKTNRHGNILTNNSSASSLIPQGAYGQFSNASYLSVNRNKCISRKNSQICSESSLKLNYAVESNLSSRQQSKNQIKNEFEEQRQSSHSQRRSNLPSTRSRVASCRTETSEQQQQLGSQFKAHKMPNFQIPFVVFKSNKPLTLFKEFHFQSKQNTLKRMKKMVQFDVCCCLSCSLSLEQLKSMLNSSDFSSLKSQPRERSTSSKTNNEAESFQQHHKSSQLRSKTPQESNSKSYHQNKPVANQQKHFNQQTNPAKQQGTSEIVLQQKINLNKDVFSEQLSNYQNPACSNGYLQYWQPTEDSEFQKQNSCNLLENISNFHNNQHPKPINQSNTSRNSSRNNSKIDLICKRQQNSKYQGQINEKQNYTSAKEQIQKSHKTHKYSQKENIPLQQNDFKPSKQQQSCTQAAYPSSNNQTKCLSQLPGQVQVIGQIHCDSIKRIPQLISQSSLESIYVPNELTEHPCNRRRQFHFL